MEIISGILKWLFTYIFYPVIIVSIFAYVVYTIAVIVKEGGDSSSIARRLTGSLLPIVLLVFVVVTDQGDHGNLAGALDSLLPVSAFFLGAVIGLVLMELGKKLLKSDSEVGPALYALFLSSVGVFILYSIMTGILKSLHVPLLGMVLSAGLDIIFRGPPTIE